MFRLHHQGHLVHGPCNRSYSKSHAAANENMHVVCRSITRVRCKRTSKPRPPSQPSTTHTRLLGYIQNPGDMKLRPGTTDHFSGVVRAGRLLDILCRSRVEAVRSRSLARRHVGDGFYWASDIPSSAGVGGVAKTYKSRLEPRLWHRPSHEPRMASAPETTAGGC